MPFTEILPSAQDAAAPDPIEAEISAAIARAFRSRAAALRSRAADATTIINGSPPIITSEAAPLLRFAADWEAIAAELERGSI